MQATRQHPSTYFPHGLVATKSWLMDKGVQRHTVDNWVKSGQLIALARGVYVRPESELTWPGIVCSLQRMDSDLTPGGLTALEYMGMAHYLPLGSDSAVQLYGRSPLPDWLNQLLLGTNFRRNTPLVTNSDSGSGSAAIPWRTEALTFGKHQYHLRLSSPELAFLEVLTHVPHSITFEHADNLIQGLATLSPKKLNWLLEHCENVKVKRLFLWLAERNQTPWFRKLDLQKFSMSGGRLGSGKRVLAPGGTLNQKYLITVPREMATEQLG